MFRRKSVTGEVMQDGRAAYDSILKTNGVKTEAIAQELTWANVEDNPYFLLFFGKMAEIQFILSEAEKQMAETYLEVNKAFRHIFQEERILEETKKEQQNYLVKITKLQKQLETNKKKGDQGKLQNQELEASAQSNLYNQLSLSVEAKAKKLELYKVNLLKKGLKLQSKGMLTLSSQQQQLCVAQMELINLLPDAPPTLEGKAAEQKKEELEKEMSAVVRKVALLLDILPPVNGGIHFRKTKSESVPSSPGSNRQSLMDPFSYIAGRKESPKVEKKVRHSSYSSDKLERVEPNNDITVSSRSAGNCSSSPAPPPPAKAGCAHCEIMIPSMHTTERPTLAKSKSETSMNQLHSKAKEDMSSRFDRRLEEAGLLKISQESATVISPSTTPFSSTEDIAMMKSEDPGYAKLSLFSPALRKVMQDDEDDYMNPADALKTTPRVQQINHLASSSSSPSPPVSPLVSDAPSKSPPVPGRKGASPYQSVDEIRKMREKQIKKETDAPSGSSHVSGHDSTMPASSFQDDENVYSRPFDALKTFQMSTSDVPPKKQPSPLPWQRTPSNGKKGTEHSAKFLHQIESSSKDPQEDSLKPGNIKRSTSSGARMLKASSGGKHQQQAKLTSKVGSKSVKQTSVTVNVPSTQTKVNRYILEVENQPSEEQGMLRGVTGRTCSLNSALYTPEKISRLRSGHAHVTLISGKPAPPTKSPQNDQNDGE